MNPFKKDKPEEAKEELKIEEKAPVAPANQASKTFEDKCNECSGDGLIWHEGAKRHERCDKCHGTGKQSSVAQEFALGTTVIKPDGTYIQTEKGLLKQ